MTTATRSNLGLDEGDVLAGPLPDGRFGAVHVIAVVQNGQRRGRDCATLVCTRYIGAGPAAIDEPTLRSVLRRHRFMYRDDPAITITDRPPPSAFVRVGNFPPTDEERAIDPQGRNGAHWQLVTDVYLEWRWEHDREALTREVNASRQSTARSGPGQRRMHARNSELTEDDFWALIASLALEAGDGQAVVRPLADALARRSPQAIQDFEQLLTHKLFLLDGRAFAAHAGPEGRSDDGFLYARCHVVARGREFYEDVLAHPERFPSGVDFEALLYVASDAYLARTGDELDGATQYSYETGSNIDGWR